MATAHQAKSTNAVDKYIGQQIRARRLLLGLSQQALATALGVTFQQVQKYEKGTNRVSASRLQAAAAVLGMPVETFLSPDQSAERSPSVDDLPLLASADGLRLLKAFAGINDAETRRSLLHLAESLAAAAGRPDAAVDSHQRPRQTA